SASSGSSMSNGAPSRPMSGETGGWWRAKHSDLATRCTAPIPGARRSGRVALQSHLTPLTFRCLVRDANIPHRSRNFSPHYVVLKTRATDTLQPGVTARNYHAAWTSSGTDRRCVPALRLRSRPRRRRPVSPFPSAHDATADVDAEQPAAPRLHAGANLDTAPGYLAVSELRLRLHLRHVRAQSGRHVRRHVLPRRRERRPAGHRPPVVAPGRH